jgi:hypothetical protein
MISVLVIVAALACPAHTLWRVLRGETDVRARRAGHQAGKR